MLSGAEYTGIAAQLELRKRELDHALIPSRQIDYLGKMPAVTPKPVPDFKKMRSTGFASIKKTRPYLITAIGAAMRSARRNVMAEQIRQILMQEQDHQIDLANALGEEVPDLSGGSETHCEQASLTLNQEEELTTTSFTLHRPLPHFYLSASYPCFQTGLGMYRRAVNHSTIL